jgi:hypothetical protein
VALEVNRKEYDLRKLEEDDIHRRKMEEAKLSLEEKMAFEKTRVDLATAEASKAASDAIKQQTAMMASIFQMLSKQNSSI